MINRKFCTHTGLVTNGEFIWYVTEEDCKLMQICIETGIVKCLGVIPTSNNIQYSYRMLIYHEKKIYILPYLTLHVIRYDLSLNLFEIIDLPDTLNKYGDINITGGLVFNNTLVMYGRHPYLVFINLMNKSINIKYIDEKSVKIDKAIHHWFYRDGFILEDKIIIPIHHYNVCLIYDYYQDTIDKVVLGDSICYVSYSITLMFEDNICMGILDEDKMLNILKADIKSKSYLTISKIEGAYKEKSYIPFLWGGILDGYLLLLPGYEKNICRVNLINGNYEHYLMEELIETPVHDRNFYSGITLKNFIVSINVYSKKMYLFSNIKNNEFSKELKLSNYDLEIEKSNLYKKLNNNEILVEDDGISNLASIIEYIISQK